MKTAIVIIVSVVLIALVTFLYFGRWPDDFNALVPGMSKTECRSILSQYGKVDDIMICDTMEIRRGIIDGYAQNQVAVFYNSNDKVASVVIQRFNVFSMWKWTPKMFWYSAEIKSGK